MVSVRSAWWRSRGLIAFAVASVCGVAAWLVLAKANTIVPAIDGGSATTTPAEVAAPVHGAIAHGEQPRRQPVPASGPPPSFAAADIDPERRRTLDTLRCFEIGKAYEALRASFDCDAHDAATLCEFAVRQAAADEAVLLDEPFLSAVLAAWLEATGSPHAVLDATLRSLPADVQGLVERQLLQIAGGLTQRDALLPPQPEGQQRALVHALIAASNQHADRLATGVVVACAIGRAADHDPAAQAALMRLARSPEGRIQELAWSELATELTPSVLLPVIDAPLPTHPDDHDTRRVLAALRSIRNAPDQTAVVHRWLGVRLVDLARQGREEKDPKQDASRVRWLRTIGDQWTADDRTALQAELQVLADGQGELAEHARRLLTPR